jgi:hypothetical protein
MKREKSSRFLEVTYLRGRPWAAYLQLSRRLGQRPVRSRREERGLVVDLARDGTPLGIEITAPGKIRLADLNRLLKELGAPAISKAEFAPLVAA